MLETKQVSLSTPYTFCEKETIEKYSFRGRRKEGWTCTVYVDEGQGSITINYGDYSYTSRWNSRGGRSVKRFVTECDIHYLMKNFDKRSVFDLPQTIRNIKRELREDKYLTAEIKREVLAQLAEVERIGPDTVDQFFHYAWTGALAEHVYQDPYLPIATDYPPNTRYLFNKIWPRIKKVFEKETRNER